MISATGQDYRPINRREALKMASATLLTGVTASAYSERRGPLRGLKEVIVGGGGIAGLSCAYELMKRGHDVTSLEAARKPGGHVRTSYDPLADGLYADVGAEHFYKPRYRVYWRYVKEFGLPVLPYPRRDNMLRRIGRSWYTPQDLHSRKVLASLGFNQREINYLERNSWSDLPLLYFRPYIDRFENQPFGIGLDHLDQVSVSDLLKKDGASAAALRFAGGESSALEVIWQAAIKKLRGAPYVSQDLYRIKGGNQRMTNTLSEKLGERVHLGAPVTSI